MELTANTSPVRCSNDLNNILFNNEEIDFLRMPLTEEEQQAYLSSPTILPGNVQHHHWLLHFQPARPKENVTTARRRLFSLR